MVVHHGIAIYLGLLLVESLSFLGFRNASSASLVLFISFLKCLTWVSQRQPDAIKYWLLVSALCIPLGYTFYVLLNLHKVDGPGSRNKDSNPLRPLILPSRTTHTRLFPRAHSFSYSYLLVGIPVQWRGSIAGIIGVDGSIGGRTERSKSWFSVHADDYLARGNGQEGLGGKLRSYVESQGESINDYPHSYLVTAPRFLGYSFNPVSFWYLYNKDMALKSMILEVNNTFDERRIYFLKRNHTIPDGDIDAKSNAKFRNSWTKDFHVSPFNSRKGGYSLVAEDPFASTSPHIDNCITLKSSKAHSKLVARVFSTEPAIEPFSLTANAKVRLIFAWCWVGFMTFPRILKEATKLFFQRKLHVWYRPEVIRTSIGRTSTWRESVIGGCFTLYTQHLSECLEDAERARRMRELPLSVLTPQFYSDVVIARSPADFISGCCKFSDERRVIHFENKGDLEAMTDLLDKFDQQQSWSINHSHKGFSFRLRWAFLQLLRGFEMHPLDSFICQEIGQQKALDYFRAVISLLVSRWLCFGVPEILDFLAKILNAAMIWYGLARFLEDTERVIHAGFVQDASSYLLDLWILSRLWNSRESSYSRITI